MIHESCGIGICLALRRSKIGIAIIDKQMRFQQVNQALAAMNGIPAAEHIGESLESILGSFGVAAQKACEGVFRNAHPVDRLIVSGKKRMRPNPGTWIGDYVPLMNASGQVCAVCAFVTEASRGMNVLGAARNFKKVRVESAESRMHDLTTREFQVLAVLAQGKSNKQAADILQCSVKTIETYRARVMLKLGLNSLVDLVRFAIKEGIVEL